MTEQAVPAVQETMGCTSRDSRGESARDVLLQRCIKYLAWDSCLARSFYLLVWLRLSFCRTISGKEDVIGKYPGTGRLRTQFIETKQVRLQIERL